MRAPGPGASVPFPGSPVSPQLRLVRGPHLRFYAKEYVFTDDELIVIYTFGNCYAKGNGNFK